MQHFGHKLSESSKNTEDTQQVWFFKFYFKVKLRLFKPNFRAFEIWHYALVYIVVISQTKNKNYWPVHVRYVYLRVEPSNPLLCARASYTKVSLPIIAYSSTWHMIAHKMELARFRSINNDFSVAKTLLRMEYTTTHCCKRHPPPELLTYYENTRKFEPICLTAVKK